MADTSPVRVINHNEAVARDKFLTQTIIFNHWVFGAHFLVGVVACVINLRVLFSKGMGGRSNHLLAAMACADFSFFLSMFPLSFELLLFRNEHVQQFYYHFIRNHLLAFSNWFCAASSWFVVLVSVERLMAIATPLHVRSFCHPQRLRSVVTLTVLGTFILTCDYHVMFSYHKRIVIINSSNESVEDWMASRPLYPTVRYWFTLTQIIIQVLTPVCLLLFLNSALLVALFNRPQWQDSRSVKSSTIRLDTLGGYDSKETRPLSSQVDNEQLRCSNTRSRGRSERKLTIMVCSVSTCVLLTMLPSALLHSYSLISSSPVRSVLPGFIANALVTFGKVANFFLFCLSSTRFRHQAALLLHLRVSRCLPNEVVVESLVEQPDVVQGNAVTLALTPVHFYIPNDTRSRDPTMNTHL